MNRFFERATVVLMVLAGAGHGIGGTLLPLPFLSNETLWSFSGALLAWLIAALGWLGINRPGDRGLALTTIVSTIAWNGLMIWFMLISRDWLDPRPWLFIFCSTALLIFAARRIAGSAQAN